MTQVTFSATDWRSEAGSSAVIGPVMARATVSAFRAPVARITIDLRRQDRCDAHGQGSGDHQIQAAEFLGRVGAGDRVQLDQAGRQPKGFINAQIARLVECDMAVASDAEKLHVQPAVGLDPTVEVRRVRGRKCLGNRAVEDVRMVALR